MKQTLLWFTHDADALQNARMQALLATFGFEGYGRFWALNERIALSNHATYDVSTKVLKSGLAAHLRMTPTDLDAFLAFLADPEECGLIHYESGKITTDRTQKDLKKAMDDRIRKQKNGRSVISSFPDHHPDENQVSAEDCENGAEETQNGAEAPRRKLAQYSTEEELPIKGSSDSSVTKAEFKSPVGAREAPPSDSPGAFQDKPELVDESGHPITSAADFVRSAVEAKRQQRKPSRSAFVPDFDPDPTTPAFSPDTG